MATRSSWLLLLLLVACGRTDKGAKASLSDGGDASGGSAATGSAGDPATSGGSSGVVSCLYPAQRSELAQADDLPPYPVKLSQAYPIDVTPATWGGLEAAYDINGDLVSDLIYLDDSESPRLRLALSGPPQSSFDFRNTDCSALAQLPAGRLVLRDLDGDQVPDFVIGTTYGVKAFLNHRNGVEAVLDYSYPSPNEQASLLNVGTTDLDADGRVDLVVGFDRLQSETALNFTYGVQSFMQLADGRFEPGVAYSTQVTGGFGTQGYPFPGYFAAGHFGRDGSGSVVLVANGSDPENVIHLGDRTSFEGLTPRPIEPPSLSEPIFQLFAVPGDGHDQLLAVGLQHFYTYDLSQDPPRLVDSQPLLYPGGFSHELGGGGESPRYFVYDYDHDGDLDFLERSAQDEQLALHPKVGSTFTEPLVLALNVWGQAEQPFLTVGPISAVVAHPDDQLATSAVYTLYRDDSTAPPPK